MDKKLIFNAVGRFLIGIIVLCSLLFVPAGALSYWNAWLLMGILFIPMLIVGIALAIKNPSLLQRRLKFKENETEQRSVILFSGLMFICGFVVAGLDFRFQWLPLPKWLVFAAAAVFLLSYLLFAEVLRENSYLSRTVEVEENQKVIDTGLYAVVRHPMYLSAVLLFLSMPLVLGSFFSFIIFLLYPAILVKRIKNEEEVLEMSLKGYSEYKRRVKYRLIPFIW